MQRPFAALAMLWLTSGCASSAARATAQPSACDATITGELDRMVERDQAAIQRHLEARSAGVGEQEALNEAKGTMRQNAERLAAIIDACGWPGAQQVGPQAASAAFLICQHADHDLAFQERCLELITEAVKNGQASPSDLAYIVDRVRMNSGRHQVYGTQLREGADGKPELVPIEDAEHVDERRRAVGLCRLALYLSGDWEACAKDAASLQN